MKILLIYFIFNIFSFAQNAEQEIIIDKVRVRGNVITSENTILFTAGIKEGQIISPVDFPRAIKRLWKLGLFQDIQIEYDEESSEGLSITIVVSENYVLNKILFNGNKKLKSSKIDDELSFSEGQRIEPNTIKKAEEKIKKLYAEKGFLNVQISSSLVIPKEEITLFGGRGKELARNINFNIKEKNKTKIGKVIFEGNETFSDFRLRWQLKETKQQPWYFFWRSTFDNEKFDEDLLLLSAFYKNKGYRDFNIVSDSINYSKNNRKMNLIIKVEEGPSYKYRDFSWEGMSLFTQKQLNRALALKKGDVFNEEAFNMAVFSRVQGLYLDKGYIYSRIEPQITPVEKDSLDIKFSIVENHKVYIENILIVGNTRTRENVIRRQLRIFPGDVYNQDRIARSYREVMMLNFFANANPNILPVSEDKVDIEFTVEEKPAGQASANMGYTQSLGMTGGGGLALPNFRGKGQSFSFSFNVGTNVGGSNSSYNYQNLNSNQPKYRTASISFTDPMVNDTKNLLGGSVFYRLQGGGSTAYYSPLITTLAGGSIMWGRIFKWPDDFFRGTWSFQMARRINEGTQLDLDRYAGGMKQSDGISLTQSLRRDSRDHPEFPTLGSHFSLNSTLSGWVLGGQENFYKHTLNLEWYTPTFWKFILTNSFKIGVIKELPSKDGEITFIPYNDRFIMGGNGIPYGNPLRGYDDNRVGPLTTNGNPIGGNTMVKVGTEIRVPFAENPVVYGILFAEMGNIWSSNDLMERLNLPRSGPMDLKRSVGAGIRFFMPMIGKLGFDIGYGFDRIDSNGELDPAWKTTLTFGQQF